MLASHGAAQRSVTGPPSVIVVVEDEDDVRVLLEFNLRGAGFEVFGLSEGDRAVEMAVDRGATLLIVDRLLPGIDGLEVCRQARSEPRLADVGVLVLSARGAEQDRVDGLAAGADDYVVKPFSVREVVARARVLTSVAEDRKRARSVVSSGGGRIHRWRNVMVDVDRHRVFAAGVEIELRPLEFRVLNLFLELPDRVIGREEILSELWGAEVTPSRRSIDVHVRRLREALGPLGEMIETVRGVGYRLRPE